MCLRAVGLIFVLTISVLAEKARAFAEFSTVRTDSSCPSLIPTSGILKIAKAAMAAGSAVVPATTQSLLQFSKENRNVNVDVEANQCTPLDPKPTNASCFGVGDGLQNHLMSNGVPFKPMEMMIAAHPRYASNKNRVIVVKNMTTGIARRIVITSTGPSRTMQIKKGRGIDLSGESFEALGGAPCKGILRVQIYTCAK